MSGLTELKEKWTNGGLTLQESERLINLLIAESECVESKQAEAVMNLANTFIGAYEGGHVDSHMCSIGEIYRVARTHVKDNYDFDAPGLIEAWSSEGFAHECLHGEGNTSLVSFHPSDVWHEDEGDCVFVAFYYEDDGGIAGEPFEVYFGSAIETDFDHDKWTHYLKFHNGTNFIYEAAKEG